MGNYSSISPLSTSPSGPGAGPGIGSLITQLGKLPPQRTNRYLVEFESLPVDTNSQLPFFATMVQIPSRGIRFFPDSVGPFTPVWKVPLKHEVDDRFIVEFMVDERQYVRTVMELWMNSLLESKISGGPPGSAMYSTKNPSFTIDQTKMKITSIDSQENKKFTYTLTHVYPKLILPSEFNTDNPNPLKLQVDFNYRTYTITPDKLTP